MSPDGASGLLRSVAFVLLYQAAGAVFFTALASDLLDRSLLTIRRLQLWSAVAAVAVLLVHQALEAARLAGDFAGMADPALQELVLSTSGARAHAVQVIGLMAVALGAWGEAKSYRMVAALGAVAVAAAFLLTGHTSVNEWRVMLAPLLLVHVLIVAFWFGSLLPLHAVLRLETSAVAATVLQRFSGKAVLLVPFIAVAGVQLLLGVAHGLPDFRAPYGALILAKVAGFVLLMCLAAWNKLRLVPAVGSGNPRAIHQLRRSILAEFLLLISVLAFTSTMTSYYSP